MMEHDRIIDRARDEADERSWKSLPQCSEKRHSAEHVAQLIVLSDDEDILNGIERDLAQVLAREEETEEGA